MSERTVLILSPAIDDHIPEAYEVTATCGHKCWLSPGSQKSFMDPEVDSKCIDCVGGKPAMVKMILDGVAKSADPDELVKLLRRELGITE